MVSISKALLRQIQTSVSIPLIRIGSGQIDDAIGVGKWKLHPAGKDKYRLYDLENDLAEQHDLADKFPDVVARCSKYFKRATQPIRTSSGSHTSKTAPR